MRQASPGKGTIQSFQTMKVEAFVDWRREVRVDGQI